MQLFFHFFQSYINSTACSSEQFQISPEVKLNERGQCAKQIFHNTNPQDKILKQNQAKKLFATNGGFVSDGGREASHNQPFLKSKDIYT